MSDELIWYYEVEDRSIGPVSSDRLATMLESGEIAEHQIVWRQTAEKKIYIRAGRAVASFADESTF